MRLIGATIKTLETGYCEIHLPFRAELSQQHGYFHGGVIGALADVASGYAAFSLLPPKSTNVIVEFKLNLLAPAVSERLIGRGFVLKAGRTLTVCRSDVFATSNTAEKLCATALATFMTFGAPSAK
jgi:uncharacterized protein (TIGR00369 family)